MIGVIAALAAYSAALTVSVLREPPAIRFAIPKGIATVLGVIAVGLVGQFLTDAAIKWWTT